MTTTPEATANGPSVAPLALRPAEAAPALGISERKLWELTVAGRVPHLKLGRATVYPVASLAAWLDEEAKKGVRA